jgi:hypothetical protein
LLIMQSKNISTSQKPAMQKATEAVCVFLAALVLYLSTLANNFSASHDSISYLNGIVSGTNLFHQHHLLYHFSAHLYYIVFGSVFSSVQPHYIVETFTALFGSASISIAYCFFRFRFNKGITYSFIAASVIAFSYGVWSYSTNVEVYAVSNFFVLFTLFVATKRVLSNSHLGLIAVLHSIAILFHQANVLLIPVILFAIWMNRKTFPLLRAFFQYALIVIVITASVYLYIGWVIEGNNSFGAFKEWITGYAEGHGYWQPFSIVNIIAGISRAMVGAQFLFKWPVAQTYLQRSFPSHGLADEQFFVRNMHSAEAWLYVILTAMLILMILVLVVRFIQNFKSIKEQYKSAVVLLLICLACYSIFFFFWMPQIVEFWILQTILFWIILLGTARPFLAKERKLTLTLISLSLVLFIINYFGSIRRLTSLSNDWYYVQTQKIEPTLRPNDIIVFKDGWIIKDYVSYFTKTAIVDAAVDQKAQNDELIQEAIANGGKLFLFERTNRNDHRNATNYFDSLYSQYRQKAKVLSKEPLVWVIE